MRGIKIKIDYHVDALALLIGVSTAVDIRTKTGESHEKNSYNTNPNRIDRM